MIKKLEQVLGNLSDANVTLNPDKCQFAKKQINYLGHVINEQGILPNPEMIKALTEMSQPSTVQELRRFLGKVV